MSNPVLQALGGGNQPNPLQMLQRLKQDPVQFLLQRRYNVPADVANDPNAIINHLLSSGQINQDQVNRAYQAAQRWRR